MGKKAHSAPNAIPISNYKKEFVPVLKDHFKCKTTHVLPDKSSPTMWQLPNSLITPPTVN